MTGILPRLKAKISGGKGLDPQRLYGVKHPARRPARHVLCEKFLRPHARPDRSAQSRPALLRRLAAAAGLGWDEYRCVLLQPQPSDHTAARSEAVLNVKDVPDRLAKAVVADYERGLTAEIMQYPWQSETCIGDWHYQRALYDKPGDLRRLSASARRHPLADRHCEQERNIHPECSRQA